jgi:hypothetical protein
LGDGGRLCRCARVGDRSHDEAVGQAKIDRLQRSIEQCLALLQLKQAVECGFFGPFRQENVGARV